MYNQAPEAGLASLLASRGRGGDTMLVHMTPGEVQGLQAIALAHGGSLEINPDTGLPSASWLKSLIPAIAGATLKSAFPKLSSVATSAIVAAGTGLIEGSFKKGLTAGLSAYSGANISEGLRRAAATKMASPRTLAEQLGLDEEELITPDDMQGTSYDVPGVGKVDLGVKTGYGPSGPLPAILPKTTTPMPKPSLLQGII
jgi:hypothetical protein